MAANQEALKTEAQAWAKSVARGRTSEALAVLIEDRRSGAAISQARSKSLAHLGKLVSGTHAHDAAWSTAMADALQAIIDAR